jgi:isopenicillin-N N-acyltransferase-like protein
VTEPFRHVRVRGGPRERGVAYGEEARERVRRSVDAYRDVFRADAGWEWPQVTEHAMGYRDAIERFDPRYLEEIKGIATGAGLATEDILAINVRTEVMFAAKARQAAHPSRRPGECTAFAVTPERSADGHTLLGQNWDWLPHAEETVVVLEVAQDEGPDYVTVVEAGLLAKTGMNAAGIGLVTNALVSDTDRGLAGVPYHVALRAILDSRSISDAYATLQRGFRSSSANYLVAHADGLAVDIEGAPGDFDDLFLTFPSDGVVLHTNHFVSTRFGGRDVGLWVMPDSPFRFARIEAAVRAAGPLSLDTFRLALADHANHPAGVCCHPDDRDAPHEQGTTVASVLMDLDTKTMWVADGHPCTVPYRRLDYAGFLTDAAAAPTS